MDLILQEFDLNLRNLYLFNEIDNNTSLDIIKQLNEIKIKDDNIISTNNHIIKQFYKNIDLSVLNNKSIIPNIYVNINSIGGECYPGFALFDKIKEINEYCNVIITVSGCCMSMAIIILLSVPYEQRICTKNTIFMIHQASGFTIGKTKDLEEQVKETKRITEQCFNIIENNTDITKQMLIENYNKKEDWFITPEEALKYKIVSKII
jgi:ATP-dependent protease ClpP protease subunit